MDEYLLTKELIRSNNIFDDWTELITKYNSKKIEDLLNYKCSSWENKLEKIQKMNIDDMTEEDAENMMFYTRTLHLCHIDMIKLYNLKVENGTEGPEMDLDYKFYDLFDYEPYNDSFLDHIHIYPSSRKPTN